MTSNESLCRAKQANSSALYVAYDFNIRHHDEDVALLRCADVSNVDESLWPLLANAIHQAANNFCDVCVIMPATACSKASETATKTQCRGGKNSSKGCTLHLMFCGENAGSVPLRTMRHIG